MTDVLLNILKGNAFTPHVNVNQLNTPQCFCNIMVILEPCLYQYWG
eukprot:CAMPEP_0194391900 /NCGR_PEP_ID=MMETSP0174-20130528/118478_1 /TAXON_ID=216777 /ORGANISM="Proboscia alata, Strain PI-D3" /LENGTH=45 /DNA_ID= /DNA_START= /DNA_END= /DNA_ORIENTATION=